MKIHKRRYPNDLIKNIGQQKETFDYHLYKELI